MNIFRKKVLITVATYPLPSRSHDELVCTAGILEDGSWIRIYPFPLSFISDLRNSGKLESYKYNWIELDLRKRTDDFRPESHSPANYDFRDLLLHGKLDTKHEWRERRDICLRNVFTNLNELIGHSKEPTYQSLATFKPTQLIKFEVEEDEREWKREWQEQLKQLDLFMPSQDGSSPKRVIRKLPYKFYYIFSDDAGRQSRLMIEDWEIGQLFWNCLKSSDGNETKAIEKVKMRYWDEFKKKDLHLFLGTTKEWHARKAPNPFVIIGVFYPPKITQASLF